MELLQKKKMGHAFGRQMELGTAEWPKHCPTAEHIAPSQFGGTHQKAKGMSGEGEECAYFASTDPTPWKSGWAPMARYAPSTRTAVPTCASLAVVAAENIDCKSAAGSGSSSV